jgi:hypothetical protein
MAEQNDPRWAPQDQQAGQDDQQDDGADQQDQGDDGGDDDKMEILRQALVVKKQMEEKGAKQRSPQDDSKYRSALMLLAKNKQLLDKMNV